MSSMSEEADPSENRAAARIAAAGPLPSRVTFSRLELNRILNLYGRRLPSFRTSAQRWIRNREISQIIFAALESGSTPTGPAFA